MTRLLSTARSHAVARLFGAAVIVCVLAGLAACETDSPTGARSVERANLAKGGPGGGGGGGSVTPTVGSVAPVASVQDTTLDVTIVGTGFASGAAAVWSLNGDTTRVHVKSTKFVNSTQLIARIVVPANAPLASYDVEVMLIGGKKGVGAELFEVIIGDPTATFLFPVSDASLGLKSDRLYGDGTMSAYASGVCGVKSKIFATIEASNSGDATMQTNNPTASDRKCASYPRKMTLAFSDGVNETIPIFMNVRNIANTTSSIPIGTTVKRSFTINPTQNTRCDMLLWTSERALDPGTILPADSVLVTRVAADTWRVQTQPPPNDRAYCTTLGRSFHMALDFTVVASRGLQ